MAAKIANQNINQTVELPASADQLPRHSIYQRPYDLTQVDFLRLKQFDPVLAASGGAVISFCLTFGLPLFARWLAPVGGTLSQPLSRNDWLIFFGSAVVGGLLLLFGFLIPSGRRTVLKNIELHFEKNPPGLFYRDDLR